VSLSDIGVQEYARAAALAATLELKCRLVADKTPELEKEAHGSLAALVDALVAEFEADLAEEDARVLKLAQRLRNKVIHSDFHDARQILGELSGSDLPSGGVHHVDLKTGDVGTVSDSKSTANGRVFGWLLELSSAGAFLTCERVFSRAIEIVNELAWIEVRRAKEQRDKSR
jgi:hypothetical protein